MLDVAARKIYDELELRLRLIDARDDFVIGVISNAATAENWQKLIDFIDRHPDEADYENALAYSVLMDDMTGGICR